MPHHAARGGALDADAAPELRALVEHLGTAVLTTPAGKSVFPDQWIREAFHGLNAR